MSPPPPGTIRTDDAAGMRQVLDHLVERGYQRIAYASGPDMASNIARRDPLADAVRRAGLDDLLIAESSDDWRQPERTLRSLRRLAPDAVVCYDDKLALGLMRVLRAAGIDVPGDIAVVGFDGIPFASLAHPSLTTVAQPAAELGRRAASALFTAIGGADLPPAEVLPVELVVGDSTPARR
jgi:LacI family transcriptional regulator